MARREKGSRFPKGGERRALNNNMYWEEEKIGEEGEPG